jgi:hypothetical protein
MDTDFDTGNYRYKSRERYSFGWSDPLESQFPEHKTRAKGNPPFLHTTATFL